jgi:hypothetical protein
MGGCGSSRRWESKDATGDYLWLDVRRLQRDSLLECRYSFNRKWSRSQSGISTSARRLTA